jgi:adenine-specific DNA-methyltransferase
MKTRDDVSGEKLRGGFYTPPRLAAFCLERVSELLSGGTGLRVLEPSAGDGSFVRGIADSPTGLAERVACLRALELVPGEAAKVAEALEVAGLAGDVTTASAIRWAAETDELFDVALGNPPFVRYQFVSEEDKRDVRLLGERLGASFAGVGNLWIPVLVGALARLQPGGVLGFVVPTECFTGCSARVAREWVTSHLEDVRFDLFPPRSFPDVLQEIAVLSGRRRARPASAPSSITILEHQIDGAPREWSATVGREHGSWTHCLLEPIQREALDVALGAGQVRPLGSLARLEVSIVTGANDFFCVSDARARDNDLSRWAKPLLPRSRNAPGLVYTAADQAATNAAGARCWLLDFSAGARDPMVEDGPGRYLQEGIERGLPRRYKCRIREPWYRVPGIRAGELLLSKRSHEFPRLIANQADVFTTDTIYRGWMRPDSPVSRLDLVASFHSSLTLLTAELEGRSFGGGVLELVPSEVARLGVCAVPGFADHLLALDRVTRTEDGQALVDRTDAFLVQHGALPPDVVAILASARDALVSRRLDRNRRGEDRSLALAA